MKLVYVIFTFCLVADENIEEIKKMKIRDFF